MRFVSYITMTAVLLGAVASAAADDPAAGGAAEARRHFDAGEAHYREQRYDAAIAEYQAAYEALPEPAFLFNIAQSYRLGGNPSQAIAYYDRYLLQVPEGRVADAARKHIADLGGRPSPPAPPEPVVEPTAEPAPAGGAVAAPLPGPPTDIRTDPTDARTHLTDAPAPRSGGGSLRIAGLSAIAGGVLLSGTAVYFGLRARRLDGEVSDFDGDMWMTELDDKIRDGNAAERNAAIFGIAGGAAITAGTVLYVMGHRRGHRASIAIVPGTGGARLVASGRF